MHYILIDHENVQPADLAGLNADQAHVLVFTGAEQKVGIGLIEAVQARGDHGRFIRITGNGRNALDFHIACYLGQLMVRDPQATFLVVSKDTGYDPLIAHLNASGACVKRVSAEPLKKEAVKNVTQSTAKTATKKVVKKAVVPQPVKKKATAIQTVSKNATTISDSQRDADRITTGLKGMLKNLPGSELSLRRMAATWLASKDIARMDKAVIELKARRVIDLTEPKIRYALPK